MNTDHLITMLSTNLEPVKTGQVTKPLAWALVVGGAATFGVMSTTVGVRIELGAAFHLGFLALKLLFTLTLIGLGTPLLVRLAHPGSRKGKLFALTFLSFLVMGLAGAVALAVEALPDPTSCCSDHLTKNEKSRTVVVIAALRGSR